MITWHYAHPTSEHSFNTLKRILNERRERPYSINCPKVYNPYGLATYLHQEPEKRVLLTADNIYTGGQKRMLKGITDKTKEIEETSDSENTYKAHKNDTIRGQKYDFIIKIMKKFNSTDIADIMIYYKNTKNENIKNTWEHLFRNTPQLNNIIQAAATDMNVVTKVMPVWEQIRQKKDYFEMKRNCYWDVQTSLNIYESWCKYHNINTEEFGRKTFEVCHKIRAKINGLHITGVSNSGKSYILRSIRNGLMNCGRMRCQALDNFTYGSCVDKTLIYTDELWSSLRM